MFRRHTILRFHRRIARNLRRLLATIWAGAFLAANMAAIPIRLQRIDPRVSALGAQCYGLGHIHGASGATLWAASHLSQHIIYGYVQIGTDGGVSLELDYVFELEGILAMKAQAPDLKVMLGGANISRTGRAPPLMIYFSRRLGFWC